VVDFALWELECSGLVYASTDEDGVTVYSVAPLAESPTAELVRTRGWEGGYVNNLKSYIRLQSVRPPQSPLVRDLLGLEPRKVHFYSDEEKTELICRIDRALQRCPDKFHTKLKWLKAECERHLNHPMSADDIYRECAEEVLREGPITEDDGTKVKLLIEAATIAKARAQTEPQLRRAISYLTAIAHTEVAPLRVFGMLAEYYAILGDRAKYEEYLNKAMEYRNSHTDIRDSHLDALDEALERAKSQFERRRAQTR
jgi:uncharacterized protein YlxP (DUF503 family)